MSAHRHLPTSLLLGLSLAACQAPATPNGGTPRPSPAPSSTRASASPSPAPQSSPNPSPALRLPLRLGLALPTSVVGAAASARLRGEGGLVAPPASSLTALQDGRIVSNNSGSLVSNNSGSLVSDQGAAWRLPGEARLDPGFGLLQSKPLEAIYDPRTELWFMLALIDLNDQILQGYVQAQPRLGAWQRFRCQQARLLPPPAGAEIFALATAQLEQALQQLPMAGHLAQEGDGLHLRLVLLPQEGASVAEGRALAELVPSPEGGAIAKFQLFSIMLEAFGLQAANTRLVKSADGGLRGDSGENYRPPAERGALAKAINGERLLQAIRRRVIVPPPSPDSASLRVMRAELKAENEVARSRVLTAFGFALPDRPDLGLANYHRTSEGGPTGPLKPFSWRDLDHKSYPGDGPVVPRYLLPTGESSASPPAGLAALLPPYNAAMDEDIPALPEAGEAVSEDPALRIPPLPAALLQAPGAQGP